jgi:hypothetical protein
MRFHRRMQAQCSLTNFSSSENVSVWIILPPAAELLRCLDVGAGKQHARVRSSSRLTSIHFRVAMVACTCLGSASGSFWPATASCFPGNLVCGAPASKFVLFVSCEWCMLACDVCYNHVCCTVILITSSSSSSLILSVGVASRRVNESGDMDVLQFRPCFLRPRIRRGVRSIRSGRSCSLAVVRTRSAIACRAMLPCCACLMSRRLRAALLCSPPDLLSSPSCLPWQAVSSLCLLAIYAS